MKKLRKDLFRIFLIVLLCVPMMAKAAPSDSSASSNVLYADNNELTKEDYEARNKAVCIICITLNILIVISIVALVIKLYKLNKEKEEIEEEKKKKKE